MPYIKIKIIAQNGEEKKIDEKKLLRTITYAITDKLLKKTDAASIEIISVKRKRNRKPSFKELLANFFHAL